MSHKTIILFDMDGTLTPARLPADASMGKILNKLTKYAKVGIVTGSDFDYLMQQCAPIWEEVDLSDIVLMPCNGTKLYNWINSEWKLCDSVNMKEELGESHFNLLMKVLIGAQFTHISTDPDHDLTGHFISYRGSMINWCPVGRNASQKEREKFISYDKKTDMRFKLMTGIQAMLNKAMGEEKVMFALGGNTSIDIYPVGWDKTYALKHFPEWDCWFVGDRCEPSGNDFSIYEKLSKEKRAYKTSGPEDTISKIETIISKLKL